MICEIIYLSTEIDLLDLRLHELDGIVDKFIVVEYPTDYSGRPRTMYYNENKERFKEFENKIIHVIDTNSYNNAIGLSLVSARQNSSLLMKTLSFCSDTDFILVCDGDAVIKKQVFNNLDTTKHTVFRMEWCSYWINAYCPDVGFDWAFGVPVGVYRRLGGLNTTAHTRTENMTLIPDSGWHWSKLGGVEKIRENILGYPHLEYATNTLLLDPVLIQERINNMWGWDDVSRGSNPHSWKYKYRKFDSNYYPSYIGQRMDIFSKYIKHID